ncbi:hypothetical protein BJP34_35370 [Moorena producens PAL-8-15-08-1]|uniref:Uncharacterized protein n=1 Tax=Moorena producens PAL-8-15-08-1 TaxID=1458985 RepID=A0A1D8U272_9CYAN|nr:hypothetical protein [Moorena producens]AOX04009.1 hypothetical protein BJP34_35370 [Moorena producens PAL-8-15-08-1]
MNQSMTFEWGKKLGVADSGYDFAPLAPQFCSATRGEFNAPTESAPAGQQNSQSPPKLGDLGGLTKAKQSRIHTSIQQRQKSN